MHLEVTATLAMVCLAGVVGAATLASLSPLDQYSPQHQSYPLEPREIPERSKWKDNGDDAGSDSIVQTAAYFRNGMIISNVSDPIATPEDHELNVDGLPEDNDRTLSAEEDDFVADDNFQDQGPGSVEVYKLDLTRDKSLLNPPIPKKTFFRSKSKTPKKASFSATSWKPKNSPESKILNPKILMEPLYEKFGIGGVPELQVGCEGLEASHRSRRSFQRKSHQIRDESRMNPLRHVTPLSIDLEYDSEEEDDGYEDELLKIKMIEATTKKPSNQKNRGDIEATLKTPADLEGIRHRPEKLPNRGDLGESTSGILSQSVNSLNGTGTRAAQLQGATETEHSYYAPVSRQNDLSLSKDPTVYSGSIRKLLSVESDDEKDFLQEENPKRVEREALWGFGEDEGAITSEELETLRREREEDEFRKREYERRREEIASRHRENRRNHSPARNDMRSDTTSEIERIKQEYERILRKQERRHRNKTGGHVDLERRRGGHRTSEEKRRREEEEKRMEARRKWQEEQRRRFEEKRRDEENRAQRERIIEHGKLQEEERRRQEAERRTAGASNLVRPASKESEEERQRKLEEYVRKNKPIIVDARRQSEIARREEEERKLQDYIRRMQPVDLSGRNNSRHEQQGYRERENIADTRMYQPNYPINGRSNHGPSAPPNVASQASLNEARRRQEARRLEEERRRIERQKFLQEEERREALVRKVGSRRYEEDRKRLEAVRVQDERRRHEGILEEYRRANSGRTVDEGTGSRQELSRAPANLILTRDRNIQELGRRRLEAQRKNQELEIRRQDYESRAKEQTRLNSLPVRATIIVRPSTGASSNPPRITLRNGFENEIDFPGINPNRQGLEAARFPVPATVRPPVKSPSPCVWAILQCCPSNNRLTTCFESMGCPGVNWDPNPCRGSIAQAAHSEIMKFYEAEDRH